ncbi:hypothetical protein C5E45_03505 [Nocardia nova]|uniref:Uncharacterized protein n=2 Tax=Nocardia nova TaxID=37330 RepID=A0A2S6AVK4_9NOCA|nr:hypothetical protein C5E41_02425 [Nocardia nova]PPJ39261.1 hypothetical protein C5E45_03505 [Nocardia nova]
MLLIACQDLAERVRQMILHSPRPVFLYHVTLAFEALFAAFERGEHPRPDSLAMQLCLHVAIDHARGLACSHGEKYVEQLPMSSYDYDFHSLYDTLLPDDGHEHLVELARMVGAPDEPLDFIALGDLLTGNALGTFFEPFELGDRVA